MALAWVEAGALVAGAVRCAAGLMVVALLVARTTTATVRPTIATAAIASSARRCW